MKANNNLGKFNELLGYHEVADANASRWQAWLAGWLAG